MSYTEKENVLLPLMHRQKRSKYKQMYFYIEDGQYNCVVALYKKQGVWNEGRIVYGKMPNNWGERRYVDGVSAEDELKKKYDYVEFVKDSKYEYYYKYINN